MLIQNKAVVIVDAFSTGKYLPSLIKGYGYQSIHIQSCKTLPDSITNSLRENKECFIKHITYEGNMDLILHELSDYDIKMVLPGCESGVEFADLLSANLNLYTTNDPSLSNARRDKYIMHETLKKNDISAIEQFVATDKDETIERTDELGYPVVVKPRSSAGTDNVYFCYNKADICNAYETIINKVNLFGAENKCLLVQKMIMGQEYIVNTVSHNGVHCIVNVLTSNKIKINQFPVYDYQEMVDETDENFKVLSDYVKSVLDALKIKFGAGHAEVMVTENGPVLIEIGARLAGSIDPSFTHEVQGLSHVSVLVDSYLNTDGFYKLARENQLLLKQKAYKIFLISQISGLIKRPFDKKYFTDIENCHSISFGLSVGDKLEVTNSLISSPGMICIIAPEKDVLDRQYVKIREIENRVFRKIVE